MNTPFKKKNEAPLGPVFEPFPEPRTMPEGWDLSGLSTDPSRPGTSGDQETPDADPSY